MNNNFVIGIQCFVKLDTLKELLDSLEQCVGKEKYTVVFYIDTSHNMHYKNRDHWHKANQQVIDHINLYKEQKEHLYKTIKITIPQNNVGPYIGCKMLVDECFQYSDYVIFSEDDAIFAKDYLIFYEKLFDQYISLSDKIFGGSAHSCHWHCKPTATIEQWNLIEPVLWINCTEFAVPRHIWEKFGHIRGEIVGDRKFAEAVKAGGCYTYYPLVDRFYKSGVDHPDAFTVYHNHKLTPGPFPPFLTNSLSIDPDNYQLMCKNSQK